MKYIVLTLCLFLPFTHIYSQSIADAGEDIHRCSPDSVVILGGDPTAFNGVPPYVYEWWIDPISTGSQVVPYIHASSLLNDTSVANPSFIYIGSFLDSSLTFFLKITDSLGDENIDSIHVTTSIFNQHLAYHEYWINDGDSVYLNHTPNIGGGFGETTYAWNPSYGLSDTTVAAGFWANPHTSTAYTASITDSKGCEATAGGPLYYIWVNPMGIKEKNNLPIKIYPNPTSDIVYMETELNQSILKSELYSLSGTLLKTITHSANRIDLTPYAKGVYILKLYSQQGVSIQRIVKH